MTYILSLTYPVAYDADDDDHARVIAEHIDDTLTASTLPHGAEIFDGPGYVLESSRPGEPSRLVVGEDDFISRYAPLPPGTGHGCKQCAGYVASSNDPAGAHVGLVAEIRDDLDR